MVSRLRLALSLLAVAALAACAHKVAIDPAVATSQAETAAMAPLGADYPDVVMSLAPKGTTLEIKEEPEGVAWDRTTQETVNAEGLKLWKDAWRASNPDAHATLTLRFVSDRGPLISQQRVNV